MKLKLLVLIALLLPLGAAAQFEAGLRNSRFVNVSYTLRDHFSFRLEHSVYAEKFGFQEVGLSAAYRNEWRGLGYGVRVSGSTSWNGDYQHAGLKAHLSYSFFRRLLVFGCVNPLYDTDYKYKTCFSAGASCNIVKGIDVLASYTTVPDFRKSEKRVHAGFMLRSGQLYARPVISVPITGNTRFKSLRVLASLGWTF